MRWEASQYADQVFRLVSQVNAFRDSGQGPISTIELSEADFDLLVNALDDTDLKVRQKAAWILGLLRRKSTIKPLLHYVRIAENIDRGGAVWSLGRIADDTVVEPLIEAMSDTDPSVRSAAVSGLARRGEVRAIESFLRAFRRVTSNEEDDQYMRWEIIRGIRWLSQQLDDKASFSSTTAALDYLKDDEDPLMKREATRSLEWFKTPQG